MNDIVNDLAKAHAILAEMFANEDDPLPSWTGDRLVEVDQYVQEAAFIAEEMLK